MGAQAASSETVREAFVSAIARNDAYRAEQAVLGAIDAGMPVRAVYLEVIQPALHEIGRRWELGELTVAQEHLATATAQAIIARLAPLLADAGRPPRRPGRAIVACTPGEQHSVGARFVADFLEADGWEVLALGPSTPVDALIEMVTTTTPEVVALSTSLTPGLGSAREVLSVLKSLEPRPLIAAGGCAYEGRGDLARNLGADLYADDAEELRDLLRDDRLAASP